MKTINLDRKKIGHNFPVFLIAEAGVNHNGEISLAKELVDVAVEANVDAIKFQTYHTDRLILKSTSKVNYQKKSLTDNETFYEMLKRYELNKNDFIDLKEYCEKKRITFLSTPFDTQSVKLLEELDLPAFKVGSGDMNNFPLLEQICSLKKPILLSTGMSNLKEVKESVIFIKKNGIDDIVILQCTSNYPTKIEDINLNVIDTFLNEFSDDIIGFSDHSKGIDASIGAVSKGAKVIEKHFTLNKSMKGPDHKASLDPKELKNWVTRIRNIEVALGDYNKLPTQEEIEVAKVVRKSIISNRNLKEGDIISRKDISIKRPGFGISPKYFKQVIGSRVVKEIEKDSIIKWEDLDQ